MYAQNAVIQLIIFGIILQVLLRYRGFSFCIAKKETKMLDKPNRSACFVTSPLKRSSVDRIPRCKPIFHTFIPTVINIEPILPIN